MEERVLAVIRRPQVLVAMVSRRRRPFDLEAAPDEPYVEVPIALSRVNEQTCPWKDKDVKAWRALSKVPRMTDRAALAMIRMVIGSVADPDDRPANLPDLDPAQVPTDLRPHLCDPSHEQQLLDSLHDSLEQGTGDSGMPEWHWSRRGELGQLPGDFVRLFLWSLHMTPWTGVLDVLAVFETLELGNRPGLRSALARLLSYAGVERTLGWAGLVYSLPEARRVRAAELILESGTHGREATEADAAALAGPDDAAWSALRGG